MSGPKTEACQFCGSARPWSNGYIEDALRAELAAERARLEFLIEEAVEASLDGRRLLILMYDTVEIPVGQTARDVIDRLRKEGGNAR